MRYRIEHLTDYRYAGTAALTQQAATVAAQRRAPAGNPVENPCAGDADRHDGRIRQSDSYAHARWQEEGAQRTRAEELTA